MFWAQLYAIMRFPKYSADGPLATTPSNAANSNWLANLLTIKVGEPATRPFFDNPFYVGKGFEMLARLWQTYAPSTKSDRFSNLAKLIFIEQGPQDSLEDVVSKIRQYAAMLSAGGWKQDEQMLTSILMKALDDRYAPIASDFSLNQDAYADLTLDEFEQKIIKWAASHKILIGPSGGASASATRGGQAPGQSVPPGSTPSVNNAADIKKLHAAGKCSCGSSRHVLENCHAHRQAGFTITYKPPPAAKSSTDGDGFTPARSCKRGQKTKSSDASASAAPASTTGTETPSTGSPPVQAPTPLSTVSGAAHTSTNQFAALDSDDEGGFVQDDGRSYASAVVSKPNATSSLHIPSLPSVCFESSSSHVASASFGPRSSIVIADSGATDHMWNDYSAFTSYHPTTSKHVTLADNTTAPVAGIGAIKILLDGYVSGLHNVLHVPTLRMSLYSLRAHRRMIGCGFIGDNDKFHVYFPSFVATVDASMDSYIKYKPLGRSSSRPYDFLQPREITASATATPTDALMPAVIPYDPSDLDALMYDSEFPPLVPVASPTPSVATPATQTQPSVAPRPTMIVTPKRISREALLSFLPNGCTTPPPIRPCDTANGSDTTRHLPADQIYRLYGNRRFKNYQNFCFAAKDSKFINGGHPTHTLGEFATIPKRKRGDPIPRPTKALEKVHLDIVFGDGIGWLGFRYALQFVDRSTRYIWVFGLKSLHADAIISAFTQFRAEAGCMASHFRTDCDAKLLSHQVVSWLCEHGSDIASSAAGPQSSNGLVERQWRTMVKMARSYLMDKQMPWCYWFQAIQHAARMMNCIPGKVNDALTTPFELIHHSPPDSRLWFPLFSIGYFHHTRDGSVSRSGFQAQTMEGIAVGRSNTSNAMVFYNPTTKQYYEPDTYKLDPSRLPSTAFPKEISYDGGIFAELYRDSNPNIPEPFPPGTSVLVCLHGGSRASEATITNIPLKSDNGSADGKIYMVLFDDGSVSPAHLSELRSITSRPDTNTSDSSHSSLPAFMPSWPLVPKLSLPRMVFTTKGFSSTTLTDLLVSPSSIDCRPKVKNGGWISLLLLRNGPFSVRRTDSSHHTLSLLVSILHNLTLLILVGRRRLRP